MSRIELRELQPEDIPFGCQLTAEAGWNQTPRDWQRALQLAHGGAWLATLDGRTAGTVTTCCFDRVAWIALLLVAEDARRQGVGRALFHHALTNLEQRGISTVRLDATPLGQPLYEQQRFSVEFTLARYTGQPAFPRGSWADPPLPRPMESSTDDLYPSRDIVPLTRADLPGLFAIDAHITRVPRAALLTALLDDPATWGRCVRLDKTGELGGFVLVREGRCAVHLGPCVALGEAWGEGLLAAALRECEGRTVYVDIPTTQRRACAVAEWAGLRVQRQLARMTRGVSVAERLAGYWASSGPEKG
ncbi:MAG: GNAT family N-acetyltransferase [Pirellulales bacterium]